MAIRIQPANKKPAADREISQRVITKGARQMIRDSTRTLNLITHYLPNSVPGKTPSMTDCRDVPSYLDECRNRSALGWLPNYPASLQQGTEAYRLGLSNWRPHPDEPDFQHYIGLRPEPLSQAEQDAIICTIKTFPVFGKAIAASVREACNV